MLVVWPHMLVVCAVVEFGLVVAKVLGAWVIADLQNSLCFLAQQPKVAHVHRSRALALDGVEANAHRRGVIAMDGGGRLWVAQLVKS